jgi:8-oxo-dGTP pyrophosphatase MutT (NUDIX family)
MSVAPLASATVVVLRDSAAGPEVLMVRRHEKSGDFPGASVFPGGLVEPEDADPALASPATGFLPELAIARLGEAISAEEAAALHVGGCRELFEEAALLLAQGGDRAATADLRSFRRELLARRSTFARMLAELKLTLALDALAPFARWITPEHQPRRWDARFFLAAAPAGQQAECDGEETSEVVWLRPAAALDAYRAGEHLLAPPTFRVLEDLDAFSSVAAAFEYARTSGPPQSILPVPLAGGRTITMVYPGDRDYPGGGGTGWNRLTLHDGRWKSLR